jgi:ribosomal protein S18 acetylase RimI-like enzyme
MSEIRTRLATLADIPAMVRIEVDAFAQNSLSLYSLKDSAAERQRMADNLNQNITSNANIHVIVAEETHSSSSPSSSPSLPTILGWSSWTHFFQLPPAKKFDASSYPADGDGEFAAAFLQANRDASRRIMSDSVPYWHLSMLTVLPGAQRRGVGAKMMAYGAALADEARQPSYVNSTKAAKPLYERFGYRVVDESRLKYGTVSYHMKRPIGGVDD